MTCRMRVRVSSLARRLTVAGFLSLFVPVPVGAQVAVSPAIVHFDFAGNEDPVTRSVQVHNRGTSSVQIRLYQRDFRQRRDGSHEFMAPGEIDRTCASNTRVLPSQARIEPGEKVAVQIEMLTVDETCWSVVFAETLPTDSSTFSVTRRVGVKVYGLPSDHPPPEGRVEDVAVSVEGDSLEAELAVTNTGSVPLRPEGRLEVRDVAGTVTSRHEAVPFSVLPGATRIVMISASHDLSTGTYLAVPLLALEDGTLIGGQERFSIDDPTGRDSPLRE